MQPSHQRSKLQRQVGTLVLVVSLLALSYSLSVTRERLTLAMQPSAEPVAASHLISF